MSDVPLGVFLSGGVDSSSVLATMSRLTSQKIRTFTIGYDDPAIIAGQGTLGLEIVEQVPNLDAVIVPVGGGGLLAGVALAVKSLRPNAKIIAVEADHVASFSAAIRAGQPVPITPQPTLADGLAIPQIGSNAFELAAPRVDRTVTVAEEQIAVSILRIV